MGYVSGSTRQHARIRQPSFLPRQTQPTKRGQRRRPPGAPTLGTPQSGVVGNLECWGKRGGRCSTQDPAGGVGPPRRESRSACRIAGGWYQPPRSLWGDARVTLTSLCQEISRMPRAARGSPAPRCFAAQRPRFVGGVSQVWSASSWGVRCFRGMGCYVSTAHSTGGGGIREGRVVGARGARLSCHGAPLSCIRLSVAGQPLPSVLNHKPPTLYPEP